MVCADVPDITPAGMDVHIISTRMLNNGIILNFKTHFVYMYEEQGKFWTHFREVQTNFHVCTLSYERISPPSEM